MSAMNTLLTSGVELLVSTFPTIFNRGQVFASVTLRCHLFLEVTFRATVISKESAFFARRPDYGLI